MTSPDQELSHNRACDNALPSNLCPQVWQLDAAAHLLATLDERYATLRAALRIPLGQRTALLAQLDAADNELCLARAGFLDAVCEIHVERCAQLSSLTPHEYLFDALDVLWDFESAWEKALESETREELPAKEEVTHKGLKR